jgi:hypothetical protein
MRGKVPVGAGTGIIAETFAAASINVSTDVITVASNLQNGKPRWQTGMKVQMTTSGVLPTGVTAATDYWVRRLSSTTIALYTSLAFAMNSNLQTGKVDITAQGSGNHTITCVMSARTLADVFGAELTADTPSHYHSTTIPAGASGPTGAGSGPAPTSSTTGVFGDVEGITNMQPSAVVSFFIKT